MDWWNAYLIDTGSEELRAAPHEIFKINSRRPDSEVASREIKKIAREMAQEAVEDDVTLKMKSRLVDYWTDNSEVVANIEKFL